MLRRLGLLCGASLAALCDLLESFVNMQVRHCTFLFLVGNLALRSRQNVQLAVQCGGSQGFRFDDCMCYSRCEYLVSSHRSIVILA